jgi:hypothetical protein
MLQFFGSIVKFFFSGKLFKFLKRLENLFELL